MNTEDDEFNRIERESAMRMASVKAAVEKPQLTELEKDAANLLFALHDAWPYVHGWCTIEPVKKRIVGLMRKHGDFAEFHSAQRKPWVGLTDADIKAILDNDFGGSRADCMRAAEAKLKEKNT